MTTDRPATSHGASSESAHTSLYDAMDHIFKTGRTIAVVGLSPDPARASFGVAQAMQASGYRIIPVNPHATHVLGEPAYPSLTVAAHHESIDLVNCFRRSEEIAPVVDEAIAIGAKAVWMQLGVVDEVAAARARAAGLLVVMDRCWKIEFRMARVRGVV